MESLGYWEIMNEVSNLAQSFKETLTDNQKKLFNEISDASTRLEAEAALTHFIEGFKLGFLICKECIEDKTSP